MNSFEKAHNLREVCAIFIVLTLSIIASGVSAQEGSDSSFVRLSGSIEVTNDLYEFSSSPDSAEAPRRPSSLTRLIANSTIEFGDYFSLPFSLQLSSRETNFTTPLTSKPTIIQFIENPLNNLSFSPKIGWAQAFIGTHTPVYSELSTGDQQIFGFGFDLKPANFELAASAGTSQRAIEPDSLHTIRGAYGRVVYMAKLGYGNPDESFLNFNFVRMNDDPGSISHAPSGVMPQEGILASANFAAAFSDHLALTGEVAGSGFTEDVNAIPVENLSFVPGSLLTQNISTRADYAGVLAFDWKNTNWGLKTSGKYIGAGFIAIGYPYLTPDRIEVLVAPRIALFDNGLNLTGSVGYRVNNLSQTKGSTTTQIIGSASVLATFSDEFSVSSQYGNFGIHNIEKNDTLRIENVSNSFSITPTYVLTAASATHTISATYSRDVFTDYNTITGALGSNNTRMIQGLYSLALTGVPFTAMMSASNLSNYIGFNDLTINSATFQLGYRLFEGKLVPTLSGTYSESSLHTGSATPTSPSIQYSPDIQRLLRAGFRFEITKFLTLGVSASSTNFTYGAARPGVSFHEAFMESSISAKF